MCNNWQISRGKITTTGGTINEFIAAMRPDLVIDMDGKAMKPRKLNHCICPVDMEETARMAGLRCEAPQFEMEVEPWDTWVLWDR